MPLSAVPENQRRAAVSEVLRWQVSKEEPLSPGGAAAAAMDHVRTTLRWAEGIVSDAGEVAECQLQGLVQKRPRSMSPHQNKRPRLPLPCRTWLPLPAGWHPWQSERKQRPKEQDEVATGQKPGVEDALDYLCAAGVHEPRVLVEFRELHEKDPLAALGVLAQFRRQADAGKLRTPNNYARSLTTEKRKEAGLWCFR